MTLYVVQRYLCGYGLDPEWDDFAVFQKEELAEAFLMFQDAQGVRCRIVIRTFGLGGEKDIVRIH
jgi:hypothetical protein